MGGVSDPRTAPPSDPHRVPSAGERTRVVIIGGGPGGYEAALTAGRQGAETTIVEQRGIGGGAVLTGGVPAKSLIATAGVLGLVAASAGLGTRRARTRAPPRP